MNSAQVSLAEAGPTRCGGLGVLFKFFFPALSGKIPEFHKQFWALGPGKDVGIEIFRDGARLR